MEIHQIKLMMHLALSNIKGIKKPTSKSLKKIIS